MKIKHLLTLCVITLSSCHQDYSPKPLGYFRIELAETKYTEINDNCSYQFLKNNLTELIAGNYECWYNIYYPKHKATVYLTYKKLEDNLAAIIEETHKLAYDHSVKSDGIIETVYENKHNNIYGVLYDIHGNSASNLQFFATDSTEHFLRGSLYFNTVPNSDSLQPIKMYIKKDLQTLIESLKWS